MQASAATPTPPYAGLDSNVANKGTDGNRKTSESRAASPANAEFSATERAYGGRESYDRAKAAGKTKLNYRQWVQVRTPKFKEWFGDWEALRAQERLDSMAPIKVRVPDEWRGLDEQAMRAKMVDALDDLIASGRPVNHPVLGEILFGSRGKKKSVSASKDPAKMLVVADIESAISNAVYARSEPTNEQGALGYSKLLVPVKIDDTELVAVLSVRHQKDGNWYYNAVALLDDNEKRPGSYESPGTLSRPLGKTPITGLDSFIRQPLRRVNPDSVSKVTDPETGEPLVVYHGTDKIISKTSKSKPFFVTKNAELASWFAKNRKNPGNVMPLYAAARNPFDYENEAHADLILDRLGIDTGEGYGAKTKSDLMDGDFVFIESDHVQRVIKAAGFDSFYVKEDTEKTLGIYHPSPTHFIPSAIPAVPSRP